jgi:DNA-binding SARP family transcriptional activator
VFAAAAGPGLGAPGQAAAVLAGPAGGHRLRESLCQLLNLARYQAGDLPGALAAYHATRRALASGLGADPGPALRGLLQQNATPPCIPNPLGRALLTTNPP